MKKLLVILFLTQFILSCKEKNKTVAKVNKTEINNKVNTLLDNWHKAAAEANFNNYFNAMDTVSVFVGTDATEVWNKQQFEKFSKPYFDKGKAWSFTPLQRNIYFGKDYKYAWFDETLQTWMGVCRGSGVIEKTAEAWKIKHYVLSMAIPNDNVTEIAKINKEKDSLYIQSIRK